MESLPIILDFSIGIERNFYFFSFVLSLILHCFQLCFCTCPSHDVITRRTMFFDKFLEGSKFSYINGSADSLVIYKTFGDVKRLGIF